ncbi:hypothetical protein ACFL6U_02710 [Planctomycetota bacterium]
MRLTRILHQQCLQLRWHLLACVGLIMVLPIEEAIVNLRDRDGHFQTGLSSFILLLAPLLTALIACANVQADLDEKRDLFWRSKPVTVSSFMTVKFLVGFFVASSVIACPVLFTWAVSAAFNERLHPGYGVLALNILLISLLTYSTCFFCNVLVRKTARAWLIGMALACFTLLVPFMLPLQFKDITVIILGWISATYLILTLGVSLLAYVLANVAAQRNWHLQTNLKGLLWAGAGLVFALTLLVTRQVASIPILDRKPMPDCARSEALHLTEGKLILSGQHTLYSANNKIHFDPLPQIDEQANDLIQQYDIRNRRHIDPNRIREYIYQEQIGTDPNLTPSDVWQVYLENHPRIVQDWLRRHAPKLATNTYSPQQMEMDSWKGFVDPNFIERYNVQQYLNCDPNLEYDFGPRDFHKQSGLPYRVNGQTYSLVFVSYFRSVPYIDDKTGRKRAHILHNKLMLWSFKRQGSFIEPVSYLDISDCLNGDQRPRGMMRQIGGQLVLVINNHCLAINVHDTGDIELVERGRHPLVRYPAPSDTLTLPLLPLQTLTMHDRIRLSIDLVFNPNNVGYRLLGWHRRLIVGRDKTLVEMNRDTIRFATLDQRYDGWSLRNNRLLCYEVTDWNENEIHCQLHSQRPFTFWENLSGNRSWRRYYFVQGGHIYLYNSTNLMVFDITGPRGLRKIGHFERLTPDFEIEEIFVEDNGNILLFNEQPEIHRTETSQAGDHRAETIYLLKGPQS